MALLLLQLSADRGKIIVEEDGEIYWDPQNGNPPELLADKDSLCGLGGLWQTSPSDPFRDACDRHDIFYVNRKQYEDWGFTRKDLDDLFYGYMLVIAGNDLGLQLRAKEYYTLVRCFGWIPYYKHPAGGLKALRPYDHIVQNSLVDADLVSRYAYLQSELNHLYDTQLKRLRMSQCPPT